MRKKFSKKVLGKSDKQEQQEGSSSGSSVAASSEQTTSPSTSASSSSSPSTRKSTAKSKSKKSKKSLLVSSLKNNIRQIRSSVVSKMNSGGGSSSGDSRREGTPSPVPVSEGDGGEDSGNVQAMQLIHVDGISSSTESSEQTVSSVPSTPKSGSRSGRVPQSLKEELDTAMLEESKEANKIDEKKNTSEGEERIESIKLESGVCQEDAKAEGNVSPDETSHGAGESKQEESETHVQEDESEAQENHEMIDRLNLSKEFMLTSSSKESVSSPRDISSEFLRAETKTGRNGFVIGDTAKEESSDNLDLKTSPEDGTKSKTSKKTHTSDKTSSFHNTASTTSDGAEDVPSTSKVKKRISASGLRGEGLDPYISAMDTAKEKIIATAKERESAQEKRECLYKILVIGELGTGKTSIIKRYVHQFFSQHYRATIGVDFALKVLSWDQNTVIRLQLWDIAGQERFGNMTRVYYKEAVGAFIVFDVTRVATFDAVLKWKQDLDSKVQLPDGSPIPCILLANKCDQQKEGIVNNPSKMDEYCKEHNFAGWFETSAKENINIDEAAKSLVTKILQNDKNHHNKNDASDGSKFPLDDKGEQQEGKLCSC